MKIYIIKLMKSRSEVYDIIAFRSNRKALNNLDMLKEVNPNSEFKLETITLI